MRAQLFSVLVLSGGFLMVCAQARGGTPLGTAFTYQGQLKLSGSAVTGTADIQCSLWDAAGSGIPPAGGLPIGSMISLGPVTVSGGNFTVQLDFGASAFLGDGRWLQIAVRSPSGSGSYTTLAPRQPLTATPYALQTRGIVVDASNNVGIGTTTPVKKLQVGDWNITGSEGMIHFGSRSSSGSFNRREWNIGVPQTVDDLSGEGYSFVIRDGTDPQFMVKYGSGYVGIGTSAPQAKLHSYTAGSGEVAIQGQSDGANGYGVVGSASAYGVYGSSTTGDGSGIGVYGLGERIGTVGTASRGVVGESYNNIGVDGQSTTSYGVHGSTLATTLNTAGVLGEATGNGQVVGVYGNAPTGTSAAGVVGVGATGGYFRSNGKGINTALYADGLAQVKCLQINGGCDLTESFNVSGHEPEAGDVVVIDADRPGELKLCASPYDSKVAGIISGAGGINPGLSMGQHGSIADGKHQVALTGRVYCRCDASTQSINVGDLLTTSPTPGHAMKATDRGKAFGAVLGKAMTGLKTGKGLVLVLVTLQ